jgi:hypothetical protein
MGLFFLKEYILILIRQSNQVPRDPEIFQLGDGHKF